MNAKQKLINLARENGILRLSSGGKPLSSHKAIEILEWSLSEINNALLPEKHWHLLK